MIKKGIYCDITKSICLGCGPENWVVLPQIEGHQKREHDEFPLDGRVPNFETDPRFGSLERNLELHWSSSKLKGFHSMVEPISSHIYYL